MYAVRGLGSRNPIIKYYNFVNVEISIEFRDNERGEQSRTHAPYTYNL